VKATSLPPSLVPLKFQARSLQFCSEMSPGSWPGEHAQWTETFSNSPLGISYEYFGRVEKQANPLTLVSQPPGNVFCSAQSPPGALSIKHVCLLLCPHLQAQTDSPKPSRADRQQQHGDGRRKMRHPGLALQNLDWCCKSPPAKSGKYAFNKARAPLLSP